MHTVYLFLYVLGAVAFVLAVANVPARINLVALGLLAWILVPLLVTAKVH